MCSERRVRHRRIFPIATPCPGTDQAVAPEFSVKRCRCVCRCARREGSAPAAPPLPWKWVELDPLVAGRRAYRYYPIKGGCGSASYLALLSLLKEKVGFPYTTLPDMMMLHAGSGYAGKGTLCGALGGASLIINLVTYGEKNKILSQRTEQPAGPHGMPHVPRRSYALIQSPARGSTVRPCFHGRLIPRSTPKQPGKHGVREPFLTLLGDSFAWPFSRRPRGRMRRP